MCRERDEERERRAARRNTMDSRIDGASRHVPSALFLLLALSTTSSWAQG
jgi:hypothetical protein